MTKANAYTPNSAPGALAVGASAADGLGRLLAGPSGLGTSAARLAGEGHRAAELDGRSPMKAEDIWYALDFLDELVERVHAAKGEARGNSGSSTITCHGLSSASLARAPGALAVGASAADVLGRLLAGPAGLGTSATRLVACSAGNSGSSARSGQRSSSPSLDVLWTRKRVAGSRLTEHVAAVRRELDDAEAANVPVREGLRGWRYDPESALHGMLKNPGALGIRFEPWSRACAEMVENGRALLAEIRQVREAGAQMSIPHSVREVGRGSVWPMPVAIGADPVGALFARARIGANAGRTTKSKLSPCTAQTWADVMDEFGLRGVATYPNFAIGSWWMGLLADDYDDWRQDYIAMLDYSFYLDYNVDTAQFGRSDPDRTMREIVNLWDMPDLPVDLQVRRMHMAADMAFFDVKRKDEAEIRNRPTDGLTAWVHGDRDRWRDFKAVDSGILGHYLSFVEGASGRDDMMLNGLVGDWADLGPDLRYEECGQAILAMTRGSLVMSDLLDCYERTVWMLNAQLTADGNVRPERYAGCMETIGTCVWQMCNHRHDVWRYYALAFELCREAESRELYAACQLADCYTPTLAPTRPTGARGLSVRRRQLRYAVQVGGKRYSGMVMVHAGVCDAVENGILPMSVVEYEFIIPLLLRQRRILVPTLLAHMDGTYCDHFAAVMRAGHASNFSRAYGGAVAALVMEQWWSGMYFAIGAGSLVEAQPGFTAGDRAHGEDRQRALKRS